MKYIKTSVKIKLVLINTIIILIIISISTYISIKISISELNSVSKKVTSEMEDKLNSTMDNALRTAKNMIKSQVLQLELEADILSNNEEIKDLVLNQIILKGKIKKDDNSNYFIRKYENVKSNLPYKKIQTERNQETLYRSREKVILNNSNLSSEEKEKQIKELQTQIFGKDAEAFRRREAIRKGLNQG